MVPVVPSPNTLITYGPGRVPVVIDAEREPVGTVVEPSIFTLPGPATVTVMLVEPVEVALSVSGVDVMVATFDPVAAFLNTTDEPVDTPVARITDVEVSSITVPLGTINVHVTAAAAGATVVFRVVTALILYGVKVNT